MHVGIVSAGRSWLSWCLTEFSDTLSGLETNSRFCDYADLRRVSVYHVNAYFRYTDDTTVYQGNDIHMSIVTINEEHITTME